VIFRNITGRNTDLHLVISFDALSTAIRASRAEREVAIRQLASDKQLLQKVTAMVVAKGGTREEATMVYSDTIIAFIKRIVKDRQLVIATTLSSYIIGIARHKWYDLLRSRDTKIDTADIDDIDPPKYEADQFTLLRRSEKWGMLQKVLDMMAVRCREVLMLWSASHSMKEIAVELQYKSEGMARKKKSECMKELMNYLYEHPKVKEQLR